MVTKGDEFNVIQFEKRLTGLKDSQENINTCCKWCLENRQHHKKIVISWLNVLKRVKVEQRLNLFYLANDVIQYSKRKHYEFVESWGTALQKATTLVRDDKVKHKIVRIFTIWQQRGVYNEEFISDLCGLISVSPAASKNDEPHEFQSSYVINKIKQCSKLERETDGKLKMLKEDNPKIQIETESLCASLKDRAHVDDVEKELEVYVEHLEGYINALKAEIKCRISNISILKQANTHLDKDKKDVKVVSNAYKVFGNKVKAFQKKLDEHKSTLTSPIPSPDINAPSPSPDSDIELPDDNDSNSQPNYSSVQFSAGYYNPRHPLQSDNTQNLISNGFTSFIGSSFNLENLNTSSIFSNNQGLMDATTKLSRNNSCSSNGDISHNFPPQPVPPIQPPLPPSDPSEAITFQYHESGHLPLLPPPMPPFNAKNDYETPFQRYSATNQPEFSLEGANPYPPPEEYNPEQEPDTWENDANWVQPSLPLHPSDTPESPPMFEKEGYVEGVEYHDNLPTVSTNASDVDHRVLHPIPQIENIRSRGKDIDHRNLISLTGSPAPESNLSYQGETWNQSNTDQDYRLDNPILKADQDYRLSAFGLENFKLLPPPPPPPPKPVGNFLNKNEERKRFQDNVESIDMDLSEDEPDAYRDFKVVQDSNESVSSISSLKPPPPLPDLPDDVDANSFLDDLNDELNSNEFTANLQDFDQESYMPYAGMEYSSSNMPPPSFTNAPPNNWMPKEHYGNSNFGFYPKNNRGNFNNRAIIRGRGRGNFHFRPHNNFRGRGFNRGGMPRVYRARGNFRGNFSGGF